MPQNNEKPPTPLRRSHLAVTRGATIRPARFLYRNELPATYPALVGQPLSAVFIEDEAGRVVLLITVTEMQPLDMAGLMALLRERLAWHSLAAEPLA